VEALECARRCANIMLEKDASSKALGIEIDIPDAGAAIASMTVRTDMLNGFDVCHGGLLFTLADTAFAFACNAYNRETLSVQAEINWRKTAHLDDRLVATATEDKRDGCHGHYSVVVRNQHDVVVAEFSGHSLAQEKPLFTPN
jgi:acyl-CoA thioesterase